MRTRTKGIQLAEGGGRIVNKEYKGQRIFQRLGKVGQNDAEAWLRARQAEIDAERANSLRRGGQRLWADAARKYLMECQVRKVRTLDLISYHVSLLLPYLGGQALFHVCNDSLEDFKADRQDEMLDERAQKRAPYPISWAEQARLLPRLAAHHQEMVEFAVNTGARDENICGLRWEWEVQVPELGRSVFVIPPEFYKTNRKHVLILNDKAWALVERRRGEHSKFVFTWAGPNHERDRVGTINTAAYQKARSDVGLARVRVHDLRHTFGQRLRDAGVSEEDRALLLGHAVAGMPQHYASATVARLVEVANRVALTRDRTTLLRVANG
jgi:integrase